MNESERKELEQLRRREALDKSAERWRSVGLAGRAGVQGLASVPLFPADMAVLAQHTFNKSQKPLPVPSQMLENWITKQGFPVPETDKEKIASAAFQGLTSGSPFGKMGMISGLTGAVSQQAADEAGLPLPAQIAAGVVGGMSPSLATTGLRVTGKTISGAEKMLRPLSETGRNKNVADLLNEQLLKTGENRSQAISNMVNPEVYVEGSTPSTSLASKSPSLMSFENFVRSQDPAAFAQHEMANAVARQKALDDLAGIPQDLENMEQIRLSKQQKMIDDWASKYEASMPIAKKKYDEMISALKQENAQRESFGLPLRDLPEFEHGVQLSETQKAINAIPNNPEYNSSVVRDALSQMKKELDLGHNLQNPRFAYATLKDLKNRTQKTLETGGYPFAAARKVAGHLNRTVEEALTADINRTAPGFEDYLDYSRKAYKLEEQKQLLQDMREKAFGTVSNPDESLPVLNNYMARNVTAPQANAELAKTLTPQQLAALEGVAKDTARRSMLYSPAVKSQGSNTYFNMHNAGKISNPILGTLMSGSLEAQRDLVSRAMVNPALAAEILNTNKVRQYVPLSAMMQQGLRDAAIGGGLGAIQR